MTKKHFEAIAKALGQLNMHPSDIIYVARSVASIFYQFNNKFDSKRFIDTVQTHINDRSTAL